VAIGHEIDVSLAELAADRRGSTPSNAAELLVPDRAQVLTALPQTVARLSQYIKHHLQTANRDRQDDSDMLRDSLDAILAAKKNQLQSQEQLLTALSPEAILLRGYAIVRHDKRPVRDVSEISSGDIVEVQLATGSIEATTTRVNKKESK
jgi:exodeoxyribonuclease VII large subunit